MKGIYLKIWTKENATLTQNFKNNRPIFFQILKNTLFCSGMTYQWLIYK